MIGDKLGKYCDGTNIVVYNEEGYDILRQEDLIWKHSSSKGNQTKYCKDSVWYKIDQFGYEGLTESISTILLQNSNVESYAKYKPVAFMSKLVDGTITVKLGCKSNNVYGDASEITFLDIINGSRLQLPNGNGKAEEKYKVVHDLIFKLTGLDILKYTSQCIYTDALLLNQDRHYNNLMILRQQSGKYTEAPIIDFGYGLLSDFEICPTEIIAPIRFIENAKSKPFADKFDVQIRLMNRIGAEPIKLNYKKVQSDLKEFKAGLGSIYAAWCIERCITVLEFQLKKYKDLVWMED